jgi:predicted GNAT superfamily acetyltransferase
MYIRSLAAFEEYEKCVELQHQVWGFNDRDLLPARYMKVTHMHGGSVLGAFEGERLIGFAFAQLALHRRQLAFYSNILAVHPACRNQGVGARLKLAQRQEALERGIMLMTWAYDPLQARNAYLNLNKLGAVVRTYMRDMYGSSSSSSMHSGLGTDRVLAEWWLDSPRVLAALGAEGNAARPQCSKAESMPTAVLVLRPGENDERPRLVTKPIEAESPVALEIPVQLNELMENDLHLACQWRELSRDLLTDLFARGYQLTRLMRVCGDADPGENSYRNFYILEACENRTN